MIGDGFQHIKHLDGLTKCTVSINSNGNPRIADIANLHHIRWLTLRVPDSQLDKVGSLSTPSLYIRGTDISDRGLAHLAGLTNVRGLYLDNCPITDQGLLSVGTISQLEFLTLNRTTITDYGIARLANLRCLRVLELDGTAVSDLGLRNLYCSSNLEEVRLRLNAKITQNGVNELRKRLPRASVYADSS